MAYVDVDKFADAICEFSAIDEHSANAVILLLRRQPTADVVEVVRCEDCQHKEQCPESLIIEGKDKYLVFCSCGKKRDGNKHAHWEYWSGWAGNHDQRIEDATCSNCGYKHPTVRLDYVDGKFIKGYVPDKLAKECPKCGAKMVCQNPNEI